MSRRAGLVAAALTATSPLLIWYSREARNYALLVLLSALSFLFFVHVLQGRGPRWLWAWGVASGLALTTHYFSVVLIVPEAAWLLLRLRGARIDVALVTTAVAVVGLALLPLPASQRGNVEWVASLDLGDRLLRVPQHFLVGLNVPWAVVPFAVGAAVAAVLVYAIARVETPTWRAAMVAGGIALAGAAIALLGVRDYVVSRNLLALWPPLVVAVGALLGTHAVRRLGSVTTAALCVVGTALAIWNTATPEARRPDWTPLARELGKPQTERVIVSQSEFSGPLVLYLDGGRVATTDESLTTSELVVIDLRPVEDYALGPCWWLADCGGESLVPQPRFKAPAAFKLVREGSTPLFEYRVYRAPQAINVRPPAQDAPTTPRTFVQSSP